MSDEIRATLRGFLLTHFRHKQVFKDSDDFFTLGFVSSLFAMELVMFVEKEFQIVVESEDLQL